MNNKYVFGLSWFAFLANSIYVSLAVVAKQIRNTPYCSEVKPQAQLIFGAIGPIVHDTLIFMATACAFVKNTYTETNMENSFDIMVLGRHLPAFSRSLLRDGQFYFL